MQLRKQQPRGVQMLCNPHAQDKSRETMKDAILLDGYGLRL